MTRTYRKLIGGRVRDGQALRFKRWKGDKHLMPRATKACFDDNPGHRCEVCNSVEKRRQVPIDVERAELALLD